MTSHTTPSLVKVTKAAASFGTPVSPLRVLIVDDDHINLSILGTLLKRRFSALLDGVPIAVDGGLKAIQALRQDVFDIVLLDVQMPGIDGVEVCKRIRNGSDGILAANQTAHVFATTTALGAVAEVVYERCGMTGTLPKPVRPANLASILLPLSKASSPSSTLVSVPDGAFVRSTVGGRHDPLPSSRADNDAPPSEAQIQKFADDLREQTKASLRSVRAMSVARSGTISHSGRLRTERCADSRSGSNASSDEHLPLTGSADGRRVTISARALCAQMAEEIARLDMVQLPLDSDNAPGSDSTTTDHTRDSALGLLPPPRLRTSPATGASTPVRPKALHRISAPAFLANSSPEARQQSALARKMPLSVQADAAGEYTSRQLTLSPTEQSAVGALRPPYGRRPGPRPAQPPPRAGHDPDTGQSASDETPEISSSELSSTTGSSMSSDFSTLSLGKASRRPSAVSDTTESDESDLDSPSTSEDQRFNLLPDLHSWKGSAKVADDEKSAVKFSLAPRHLA